jgi:hypothetical protein
LLPLLPVAAAVAAAGSADGSLASTTSDSSAAAAFTAAAVGAWLPLLLLGPGALIAARAAARAAAVLPLPLIVTAPFDSTRIRAMIVSASNSLRSSASSTMSVRIAMNSRALQTSGGWVGGRAGGRAGWVQEWVVESRLHLNKYLCGSHATDVTLVD